MKLATTTGDILNYVKTPAEALLYEIGKYMLSAYGCFED